MCVLEKEEHLSVHRDGDGNEKKELFYSLTFCSGFSFEANKQRCRCIYEKRQKKQENWLS